jgi:hypothetical protein
MKKTIVIVLILVLIGILVFQKKSDPVVVSGPSTSCYERSLVATSDAPYSVEENIKVTIDGISVSGIKSGTQSGPDMTNGYIGTLVGTKEGDALNVLFSYTIEGSNQAEREQYVVRDQDLIKLRYPLIDQGKELVPDTSQSYVEQVYESVSCE